MSDEEDDKVVPLSVFCVPDLCSDLCPTRRGAARARNESKTIIVAMWQIDTTCSSLQRTRKCSVSEHERALEMVGQE